MYLRIAALQGKTANMIFIQIATKSIIVVK